MVGRVHYSGADVRRRGGVPVNMISKLWHRWHYLLVKRKFGAGLTRWGKAQLWVNRLASDAYDWVTWNILRRRPNCHCPRCGGAGLKVIYAGLPAKLCADDECSTMWGGMSWIISLLPFNGVLLAYEGGYLPALWHWIFRFSPKG
jgi:hypothetical protein